MTSFNKTAASIAFFGALTASTSALAIGLGNNIVYFGGNYTTDDSYSGYIGATAPVNGSLDQNGVLISALFHGGEFQYNDQTSGSDVNGEFTGGHALVGYQWLYDNASIAAHIGVDHQRTGITPFIAANTEQGHQTGMKLQFDGSYDIMDNLYVSTISSFSTANDNYWSRNRLGYVIGNELSVGPQVKLQGGEEFDAVGYGAFVGGYQCKFTGLTIGATAGAFQVNGQATYGQFGLDFSRSF